MSNTVTTIKYGRLLWTIMSLNCKLIKINLTSALIDYFIISSLKNILNVLSETCHNVTKLMQHMKN